MRSLLLMVTVVLALPLTAEARQYSRGSQVVHSRRAPVALHRAFPPYAGQHVYEGRR